jgi:hypothetical protein
MAGKVNKNKGKKGGSKKGGRGENSSSKLLVCPTLIPDRYRCTMTLGSLGSVNVTAAGSVVFQLTASNKPMNDTRNPQGWDQIAAMYLRYRPLNMKIRFITGITSSNATIACLGIRGYWSEYATALANDQMVLNNRFTKSQYVNGNTGFAQFTTQSDLRTIHGMTTAQWMSSEETDADVLSAPAKATNYFVHYVYPSGTGAYTYTLDHRVEIEYEFSQPRILLDA